MGIISMPQLERVRPPKISKAMCRQYANGPVGNESEGGHGMEWHGACTDLIRMQHNTFFIRRCRESVAFIRPSCWEGRDGNGVTSPTGASQKRMLGTTVSYFVLLFKHLKRLVRIACLEHITFSKV